MPHTASHTVSDLMVRCTDNCVECARVCQETLAYCIEKGGKHADGAHLRALLDCIDACEASAHFLERSSDLHPAMCGVCADACIACAESCEDMGDDEQMARCAKVCRECASTCQEMAG